MRRHVENPESKSLGPITFFIMWTLALMALSAAAHGQESGKGADDAQPPLTPANVLQPAIAPVERRVPASNPSAQSSAAQRRLSLRRLKKQAPGAKNAQLADAADQAPLTRYILISIPDRQLALVDDGQVVKIYPIAVGAKHTPSPAGTFTIVRRVANPTWSYKGKVVGPGKDNPVGSRWIGLSLKGYGIHGTNAPRSIGKAASHGCFRMGKKDVEELFTLVHAGDTVVVRRQRDELVAQVFGGSNSQVQVASATATPADGGQE